jgi:hypothetical protein
MVSIENIMELQRNTEKNINTTVSTALKVLRPVSIIASKKSS